MFLYPYLLAELCCDWTMSSVPLVRSLSDPRNLATISLYLLLAHLAYRALTSSSQHESSVIALRLATLVFASYPSPSFLFLLLRPIHFILNPLPSSSSSSFAALASWSSPSSQPPTCSSPSASSWPSASFTSPPWASASLSPLAVISSLRFSKPSSPTKHFSTVYYFSEVACFASSL